MLLVFFLPPSIPSIRTVHTTNDLTQEESLVGKVFFLTFLSVRLVPNASLDRIDLSPTILHDTFWRIETRQFLRDNPFSKRNNALKRASFGTTNQ